MGAWIEMIRAILIKPSFIVAPLVGAWIEILLPDVTTEGYAVAPLVGAWIEILRTAISVSFSASLLSWERGLK